MRVVGMQGYAVMREASEGNECMSNGRCSGSAEESEGVQAEILGAGRDPQMGSDWMGHLGGGNECSRRLPALNA